MDKNGLIKFSNTAVVTDESQYSGVRAKSFKVKTTAHDFVQYVRTVKAYALAGMPFADIANAGDLLGDEVERKEVDAPLQDSLQGKIGEVAEDENKILAWQNRGERVSITHQLSSSTTGNEVVVISQGSITTESSQETTIDVLEGINVLKQDNPYLQSEPQKNPAEDGRILK